MLGCFSIQFPSNNAVSVTLRANQVFIPTFLFCAAPTTQLSAILFTSQMITLITLSFLTNELIDKFVSILACRSQDIWAQCLMRTFLRFQISSDNIDRNKFTRFLRVIYILDSFAFIKRSHNCIGDSIADKYLVKGVQSCTRIKIKIC